MDTFHLAQTKYEESTLLFINNIYVYIGNTFFSLNFPVPGDTIMETREPLIFSLSHS